MAGNLALVQFFGERCNLDPLPEVCFLVFTFTLAFSCVHFHSCFFLCCQGDKVSIQDMADRSEDQELIDEVNEYIRAYESREASHGNDTILVESFDRLCEEGRIERFGSGMVLHRERGEYESIMQQEGGLTGYFMRKVLDFFFKFSRSLTCVCFTSRFSSFASLPASTVRRTVSSI